MIIIPIEEQNRNSADLDMKNIPKKPINANKPILTLNLLIISIKSSTNIFIVNRMMVHPSKW